MRGLCTPVKDWCALLRGKPNLNASQYCIDEDAGVKSGRSILHQNFSTSTAAQIEPRSVIFREVAATTPQGSM